MSAEGLRAVDAFSLPEEYRALLRPGEMETDFQGNAHRLPRFFYEISSWQEAHEIRLAPHFTLAELMLVDCREARLLVSQFPHYVPCAIVLLAKFLAHQIGGAKSIHAWGTAANIYRVGDTFLSDAKSIEKYRAIAASLGPAVFVRPFGSERVQTDDHLHIDLGFASLTPRECSEAS